MQGGFEAAGQSHEGKLEAIGQAFSPFLLLLVSVTQADGLGWYNGAPLALGFAGAIGTFPVRIAVWLGVRPIHAIALVGSGNR